MYLCVVFLTYATKLRIKVSICFSFFMANFKTKIKHCVLFCFHIENVITKKEKTAHTCTQELLLNKIAYRLIVVVLFVTDGSCFVV